jgi:chromosome segregation ATPase
VLSSDLDRAKVNLSTYADLNHDLIEEIRVVNTNRSQCEAELERLSASIDFYDDQLDEKEDLLKEQKTKGDLELVNELGNLRAELETKHQLSLQKLQSDHAACMQNISNSQGQAAAVQQRFDAFVKTVSRSVCCKERVDNSNIRFYKVVDDRLLCLEDVGEPLIC